MNFTQLIKMVVDDFEIQVLLICFKLFSKTGPCRTFVSKYVYIKLIFKKFQFTTLPLKCFSISLMISLKLYLPGHIIV